MPYFRNYTILIYISYLLINVNSFQICKTRISSNLNCLTDKMKNSSIQYNNDVKSKLQINQLFSILLISLLTVSINPLNFAQAIVPEVSRDILADQQDESKQKKTISLLSGVKYYDEVVGDGPEANEGKSVQFQWVLRRSNGYFVDSSANYGSDPFVYKVGNLNKVIKGVDEGIRGMKVGGIRRLAIPPSLAFVEGILSYYFNPLIINAKKFAGVENGKPGPLPLDFGPKRQILTRLDREVWYFEIKLTKVK